jgi:tetratricopeptide (TPR) repeat protein
MTSKPAAARGSATFLLVIFLFATCGAFMVLKTRTDAIARRKVPGASIIYIPSGKFLRYATFGYSALAADLIYLWAIQYYSTPAIDDRFDHLDHVFAIINELDPRYQDPYEVGAMIAVDGARELREESPQKAAAAIAGAFAILDRGAANNPDQWVYPFNAGHIALMTLKDYPLAEKYFSQCMKIPGAPAFVERLRANAIYKKGDLETSWETWLDIYRRAPDERTKKIASNHLYQVKSAIDTGRLREALEKFRERYGRWPSELADLVRTRLVPAIPKDLDGQDYVYDPKTGEVKAAISPWKR